MANKMPLRRLAVSEEGKTLLHGKKLDKLVLSSKFWDLMSETIKLLNPIKLCILNTEGDNACLADVIISYDELKSKIESVDPIQPKGRTLKSALQESIQERYEFVVQPIHLAASLVDPRTRGQILNTDQYVSQKWKKYIKLIFE